MTLEYRRQTRRLSNEPPRTLRGRSLHVEALESRLLLDGDGFLTGTDVHLSLSFAADGTEIAGQINSLAATFDAIAPTADWQDAILRAFQTWATLTNSDIGLRSDSGDRFGSPGPSQKDDRFGDIRIGAVDMSPEVGAVSVPVDGLVSGTWFADVVFNATFDYQTLGDIYAVALHEAGNVFGLEDNSDTNSPLFTGGTPTGLPPTATDVANLQQLHGARLPDIHETDGGQTDNDTSASATHLKLVGVAEANEGTAPSIIYGDITSSSDHDFFRLRTPGDYSGSVTVQLRSSGISLLAPAVSLYDGSGELLLQSVSSSSSGDTLTLQIPAVVPDELFYLEVNGATAGLFGIGGYSLVTLFDGINQIDQDTIDSIAGGQFRFLEQDEFEEFFDADDDDLLGDDLHTNDTSLTAERLETAVGFLESNRYEVVGSIADETDVDFYKFKSPDTTPPRDVMTVLVRSLDAGGLVPQATVFDSNGLLVPSTILANGGGDALIQVEGVTADDDYEVRIAAQDANGPFNTGNYSLAISFGSQATQLVPMSSGSVGNGTTQNIHTLYVGQPQLFHFALVVDAASVTAPTALVATIKNDLGQPVYQIAAQPGETRSREAVLLAPGVYSVEMVPFSLDGGALPQLSYALLGAAISDPFVGDPDDPDAHPFACNEPGLEGFFCYPGGFVSPDPFLWDDFIDALTTPPDVPDLPTLVSAILGDWWTWVWQRTGVNGPPLGMPDTIQVPSTVGGLAALLAGPNGSVLDNDIDPEGDSIVAILQSGPSHGSLGIAIDGTFSYTPDVGFQGKDTFSYTAFDFGQESAVTTVTIIVGESGDFDADGDTDGADFLTWQRNFETPADAVLTNGDSDFDGDVDSQDFSVWRSQFGSGGVLAAAAALGETLASALPLPIAHQDPAMSSALVSSALVSSALVSSSLVSSALVSSSLVSPSLVSSALVSSSLARDSGSVKAQESAPSSLGRSSTFFVELPSIALGNSLAGAARQTLRPTSDRVSPLASAAIRDDLSRRVDKGLLGLHQHVHRALSNHRDRAFAEFAQANFRELGEAFIEHFAAVDEAFDID